MKLGSMEDVISSAERLAYRLAKEAPCKTLHEGAQYALDRFDAKAYKDCPEEGAFVLVALKVLSKPPKR
jgi:hypothetical protein